jgi:hypothetical protein
MINIANWPTLGMYQPDAIASYKTGGRDYIITANEGDARDYDGYSEEERVKDLDLDPAVFPDAATLQADENLGRLNSTTANGDADGDGLFETIYSYGARSMAIWNAEGELVFDSGDLFEQVIALELPEEFNSTNDENGSFDNRSDDKGPEPEGVAVAKIKGRHYAFIGMERVGGIFVMDVTDPVNPRFIQYVNDRDFKGVPEEGTAGDLAPEGLRVVPAEVSPIGHPLLLVANEVSGSVAIYRIVSDRGNGSDSDLERPLASGRGVSGLINSPNPFNPMTTISYSLPRETDVRLAVYNLRGELVEVLVHGVQAAGPHSVQWSGQEFPSGVYLYMIEADGLRTIQRMTLVK